jgi:hypothetical protein
MTNNAKDPLLTGEEWERAIEIYHRMKNESESD